MKPQDQHSINPGRSLQIARFVRRVNRVLFSSILLIILLVFALVFQPMQSALEKSLVEKFALISHLHYHSFMNSIQQGVESTQGLSSRSTIRDAILDYKSGAMDMEELAAFTQPKYAEGAGTISHLLLAERVVSGKVVARYESPDYDPISMPALGRYVVQDEPYFIIDQTPGRVDAIIISPVKSGSVILGHDQVLYGLESQLELLCTPQIGSKLMNGREYHDLWSDAEMVWTGNETVVFGSTGELYASSRIQGDIYFVSTQSRDDLLKPVRDLALKVAAGIGAAFLFLVIFTYFHIVRFAKRELTDLEASRAVYKQIAYTDHLTGAYTRQFLDIWHKALRPDLHTYTLVMIDIDDFKQINDILGHIAGDKVLKSFAETALRSIRQTDLLFRYGGDEFLLILEDIDPADAIELLRRIEAQLGETPEGAIPIGISYGISAASEPGNLDTLLKEADSRMYAAKKQKKAAADGK